MDMRKLIKALEAQGFTVGYTSKHHIKVYDPAGRLVTITSSTPSDPRSIKNFLAVLRRAGFVWHR